MRRSVLRLAVTAALGALVVLGVPLAAAIRWMVVQQERAQVTQVALQAAQGVDGAAPLTDVVELSGSSGGPAVGVYAPTGLRVQGVGPHLGDRAVSSAAGGRVASTEVGGAVGGRLVVAVPVSRGERVVAVVRAAVPRRAGWVRTGWWWSVQGIVSVLALAATALAARRRAARLTAPVEALSAAAQRVSGGDFSVRAKPCGVLELDELARAQNQTVQAMVSMLERERRLARDASHQLRTPLARLDLMLETAQRKAEGAVADDLAVARAESRLLAQTVEEVLALARAIPARDGFSTASIPVAALIEEVERDWHGTLAGRGRRLETSVDPLAASVHVPAAAGRQILTVLLENALVHGRGTVRVHVHRPESVMGVDVADEGAAALEPVDMFARGVSGAGTPGIGLALARELAEVTGGRLILKADDPTTLRWLVPVADRDGSPMSSGKDACP